MTDIASRVYVPASIGKEPTNPREALLSAAALLEEEGRWAQCVFYRNNASRTTEYSDNPWCNGWGTCAVGALQCVVLGVQKREIIDCSLPYDPDTESWPTRHVWSTAEDEYQPFVEGYGSPTEWAELNDTERLYVNAHQLLDAEAAERYDGGNAIELNDSDDTTREMVIALFRSAAERPDADANV